MAVVKADGYGHGAVTAAGLRWPAARRCWRWPPEEGAELRKAGIGGADPGAGGRVAGGRGGGGVSSG